MRIRTSLSVVFVPLFASGLVSCSEPQTSTETKQAASAAAQADVGGLPAIPVAKDALAPTREEMVAMRDGTRLATNIYLPPAAGPAFPVVLIRTLYGRANDPVHDRIAQPLHEAGIALVTQDTRGHGDSEGVRMAFANDGWGQNQDGVDTVEWLKAQDWCNGKIATFGGSALGITQVLLAPATRDLACQVIIQAPCDFYSTYCTGGVFQKDLSERYSKLMGHQAAQEEYQRHPARDAFWEQYDAKVRAADITAPAVHVSGWYDLYPQGAIDNFVSRHHNGGERARGNQKLIVGPWAHAISQNLGEVTFRDNAKFSRTPYVMRFFKHWLQGEDNGIMAEPAVHYYVLGDFFDPSAPGNEWRTADDWPPVPTVATPYYLTQSGALETSPPSIGSSARAYVFDPADPCPTLGGCNGGMLGAQPAGPFDQRPVSGRADVLKFETAVLDAPLEVTGPVRVKLYVSTDAPDTDFTAKLVDIYPDGREFNLADGIHRLKFRNGFETAEPLPPGEVGELEIDLWSISVIFNKGHRIGVHISSSNWPRFEVNPNTGADLPGYTGEDPMGVKLIDKSTLRIANNTVYMDNTRPSALLLPVRTQ